MTREQKRVSIISKDYDRTWLTKKSKGSTTYTTRKNKAAAVNDQFCSMFTTETDFYPESRIIDKQHLIMPDITVTQQGVQKLLKTLKIRKAPRLDGILSWILELVTKEIAPPITAVSTNKTNTSNLEKGAISPNIWKKE